MNNIPPIERKIRAGLPIIRFMQEYMPISLANWLIRKGATRSQLEAEVTREAVLADGVPCEWLTPKNSSTQQVLLYLHGGGFVFGLTPQHLEMGAYLAQKMDARVLMVDYRLAPAHPFPAALDDCVAAYCWLLKQEISAQNIVIAGDSAGGNLTLTTLLKLRDMAQPLPTAAACLSPVVDLNSQEHRRPDFKDPLLPPKVSKFYTQSYVGQHNAQDPLISPAFGDLHGLPPLLVHAGEDEILREDAIRITDLAKSANVDAIVPRNTTMSRRPASPPLVKSAQASLNLGIGAARCSLDIGWTRSCFQSAMRLRSSVTTAVPCTT